MLLATATESTPDEAAALDTPTQVVVSASHRRLTVAWGEVPGAASYKVAVRPKNQLVPKWREYTVPSSPYTIEKMWAMSGMAYEVRVAAVHARGQSEWSASVPITAPALQEAPADAIEILRPIPRQLVPVRHRANRGLPVLEGDPIVVSLHSQRPYKNKSRWHYSICNADGSGYKLLSRLYRPYRPSWIQWVYRMGSKMQGKQLSVQVDYDKEGVSYSATAVLGVVGAAPTQAAFVPELATGCPPVRPGIGADGLTADTTPTTHLYALQSASVGLQWDHAGGGAIAPLCNDLLVATPHGRLALVRPTGEVTYLEGNVPMNKAELLAHPDKADFRSNPFRVADILLKRHSAGRYELFVTHHYFTGACLRFRLSSTTLVQQGTDVSVAPEWRTVFEAKPCWGDASIRSGGRMLMDGPDHLLVTMGDHGFSEDAQDPASHLGKLVRVEIATGRAETRALGLRNPQGLARDAAGHLWGTEHGPQGGDELNLLVAGGNYGWPLVSYGVKRSRPRTRTTRPQPGNYGWPWVTYGVEYGSRVNVSRAEKLGLHDGFAKPVFAWVPSIGISSLIVNDVRLFPLWKDDLLIASLAGHALFRVRRDGTDVQYVERIEVGYRIRDFAQMPDRRIALLADGGRVHFLSRSYAHCADEFSASVYAVHCGEGDHTVAATGAQLFDAHCSSCHSLNAEQHGIGPHLVGVLGRSPGSVGGYQFSSAHGFWKKKKVWTPARLERFLAKHKSLDITQAEIHAIVNFLDSPFK